MLRPKSERRVPKDDTRSGQAVPARGPGVRTVLTSRFHDSFPSDTTVGLRALRILSAVDRIFGTAKVRPNGYQLSSPCGLRHPIPPDRNREFQRIGGGRAAHPRAEMAHDGAWREI